MNDIREREGGRERLLQISCVESKAFNSDSRRSLSLTCIDNSNGNESTEVQTLGVIRIQLIYTVYSPNSGHFGTTAFVLYLECPLLGSFVKFMLNDV